MLTKIFNTALAHRFHPYCPFMSPLNKERKEKKKNLINLCILLNQPRSLTLRLKLSFSKPIFHSNQAEISYFTYPVRIYCFNYCLVETATLVPMVTLNIILNMDGGFGKEIWVYRYLSYIIAQLPNFYMLSNLPVSK